MDFQTELETLCREALELRTKGRLVESEILEAKAAGLLQNLQSRVEQTPEDPSSSAILLYLAEREWALQGDSQGVLAKLERARALREKRFGPDHGLTAEALAKLAEFHYLAGRFAEAEPLYRQSIAIYERQVQGRLPVYAKALEGLAQTLAAFGRAEEADPFFARAIELTGDDEQGKRSLYFLLIYRAEGLAKLSRRQEAEGLRQKAGTLLPKNNPGELGYHM
jgi:tetratricopeptide (TPR) repeat protein